MRVSHSTLNIEHSTFLKWLLILILAVALRLVFWQIQARSGAVQPGDPEEYYRAALHMMQGGYHDTGKWLRPPLYPAFLALIFSLVGVDLIRTLFVQAVVSGLTVPVFGLLTWQLFKRQDIALLSGFMAALFVPLASFGSVLFAEGLFVILMIAVLAWLVRSCDSLRWRDALVCGLLLGLATLTRALALSFIPIAALLLILHIFTSNAKRHSAKVQMLPEHQDAQNVDLPAKPVAFVSSCLGGEGSLQPASQRQSAMRQAFTLGLALLFGAAIVVLPWTVRNYAVHQRLIMVDTNGGISMWFGIVRSDAEQRAGEAELWATPNLADRQALALSWTKQRLLQDPAWFIGRMRFKIASLYLLQVRSFVVGDIITISPQDQQVALGAGENPLLWSAIADLQYVAIMLLALAGFCFAPNFRRLLPILFWVVFSTGMSAITIGHPRLRLPIVAALIPLAAYALAHLPHAWRFIMRKTVGLKQASRATANNPTEPLFQPGATNNIRDTRHETQDTGRSAAGNELSEERSSSSHVSAIGYRLSAIGYGRSIGYRLAAMILCWLGFLALIFSTRYLSWIPAEQTAMQGRQALASGNRELARQYYEQARTADPTNALRSLALADLDFAEQRYQEALDNYAAALQQEDRNLYAHAMRIRTAALLGRRDIAEQEQKALAGYGRDNNEVALWAWEYFNDPSAKRVVPGDARQLGQYLGFAPATPDLAQGRWTLGNAKIRLAGGCESIVVKLHGPLGRQVRLGVAGAASQTIVLTGISQELTIQPDQACRTDLATIVEIKSSTSLLDIENAPWMVGVAVEEVRRG